MDLLAEQDFSLRLQQSCKDFFKKTFQDTPKNGFLMALLVRGSFSHGFEKKAAHVNN